MLELTTPQLMALLGGLCGFVLGAVARSARFCTFGAIEAYVLTGDKKRLMAWALAIAVATLAVQSLHANGLARIDETFYLSPNFGWFGAIFGGLLFGIGMALVGTCGFGALIRLGGGDLKSLVTMMILGLTGYMTARGVTALIRVELIEPTNADLTAMGGQGIQHMLAYLTGQGVTDIAMPLTLLIVTLIVIFCARDRGFLRSPKDIAAGSIFGLTIAAGFYVTGTLGNDPFAPQQVRSLSYVLPPGETILYLVTFTGASINFAIGSVFGTLLGAAVVSVLKNEIRIEAYDDAREMYRHLIGASLMGFGGVTALGCTIGQGISGMATLSMSAPLALIGIFVGAVLGLHFLLTGSIAEALSLTLQKMSRD